MKGHTVDSQKIKELADFIFDAASPPERLTPSQWANNRVHIKDGLTPKWQASNTPWLLEILDQFGEPTTKECVAMCPIGTGKTTGIMEAGLAYVWCEDPGPTLLVGQTNDEFQDWAQGRFDYVLTSTPECAKLLPTDRHKKKAMSIRGAHMSLYLTGANESGLQSKSMRRVLCDEPWQYDRDMIGYARGRLHDRWNRQIFLLSQAGFVGDDLDDAWNNTDKREFSFCCPDCGTWQPWKWCNVVGWEDEEKTDLERAQAAYLKCDNSECSWTCADNPQKRRVLAAGAKYIPTATGLPGHVGFHYNILCNWRKPLWEVVLLKLEAEAAQRVGNLSKLKLFIQQRLAEPWKEDLTDNRKELVGDGYLVSEYANGEKIDGEAYRFISADKQLNHFWAMGQAWRADGTSRVLFYRRVETFDQILELQRQYKVQPRMVFIDAQYDTDQVYCACASQDWTALHGSGAASFPYRKKNGDIIHRPYARFSSAAATNGKRARYAHWASDRVKDILHAHRTGQAGKWEIPDDIGTDFLKQIDGEAKREVENSKTKQIDYRWTKIRRDNHAWDCAAMQIVAALMLRIIPGFDT